MDYSEILKNFAKEYQEETGDKITYSDYALLLEFVEFIKKQEK